MSQPFVDEGDRVKEGQLIARLDDCHIYEVKVAQIKARLEARKAGLTGLEVGLAQAEAELARTESLFEGGLTSESELDQARLSVDSFTSDLDAARWEVKVIQADLEVGRPCDVDPSGVRRSGGIEVAARVGEKSPVARDQARAHANAYGRRQKSPSAVRGIRHHDLLPIRFGVYRDTFAATRI